MKILKPYIKEIKKIKRSLPPNSFQPEVDVFTV